MNKKLFILPLVALMASACGGPAPLADKDSYGWNVLGNHELADGTVNGWGDKSSELFGKSMMTARALDEVKALDASVKAALEARTVKYLYTTDIILGKNASGWTSKAVINNKLMIGDGSFALKAGKVSYDAADKVYAVTQWIPDPHTAYAGNMTPSTLFLPPWQEAKDERGFSWSDNPMCIGKAGLYTFVAAEFAPVEGQPQYGMGLILKEEKTPDEGAKAYEEVKEFVVADHTYGVSGTMTGWADGADIAMTKDASKPLVYSAEVTMEANAKFKVRADGKWDNAWGKDGADIVVENAGTYTVTITFASARSSDATVSYAAKN